MNNQNTIEELLKMRNDLLEFKNMFNQINSKLNNSINKIDELITNNCEHELIKVNITCFDDRYKYQCKKCSNYF
jgi:hypothetical protein